MATKRRTFKIAERVQEIVAKKLLDLSDPRLYLTTITQVVVSPDLKYAKVFWSKMGSEKDISSTGEAFEAAQNMFRTVVAKELNLRHAPEIRFVHDDSLENQFKINELLERAKIRS